MTPCFSNKLPKASPANMGWSLGLWQSPADRPGNGMHLHLSVIDQQGQNIFDDGSEAGGQLMQHAVAGLLAAMPDQC